MGFFGKGKSKLDVGAGSSRTPSPAPPSRASELEPRAARRRRPRDRLYIPVNRVRWHWYYHQPWPGINLPHGWHLDPHRILVSQSPWTHTEEVRKHHALWTAEQRGDPAYARDSPNWEVWFVTKHDVACRGGVVTPRM